MSQNVFVFAEQRDGKIAKVSYELLGAGARLAEQLNEKLIAILPGSGIKDQAAELIAYGAAEVIVIDDPALTEYMTEPYTTALARVVEEYQPEILLLGATSIGRDLAPRLAARVHTGLTADCTVLEIEEESKKLLVTRPAYGGNLLATIICADHCPQMATVRPGVMKPLERDAGRTGTVMELTVDLSGCGGVKILEISRDMEKKQDITEAAVLVAGGRGMGSQAEFDKLAPLAAALGGQVCGSRASEEAGWIDKEQQVGQTGKTVRPKLYIACGISGAIQHTAGMEESEYIVAINKNAAAPIMALADLAVTGDAKVLVPLLTKAIERYQAQKNA